MSRQLFKTIPQPEDDLVRFYDFRYDRNEKFPFHYDRNPRISIVLNGKLKEKAGQTEVFAEPFSVVLKPGDVFHNNEFGPQGARLLSVILHPQFLSKLHDPTIFNHWQWYHAHQAAGVTSHYLQRLRITDDPASETIDFLAAIPSHTKADNQKYPPDWLDVLCEKIHDQPEKNYSVQDLAASINLHPVYLARVFRRHFKCGVKEYIHRRRLRNIISTLSDTSCSLVEVALECGYADQSHMSRFFKQATGMSPGAFRTFIQCY